ncbi:MAG: flippase-like domain-containing protein [Deltaproteobacteria bacterium]|nr:flippase-like domain-containing protein [Deltaproteobacteria bacterium]
MSDPPSADAEPLEPEPSASWSGLLVRLGLSLVLAVAFAAVLWPRLRTIPEDLSIAWWAVPTYLLALVPYHLARAGRWHVLLRPLGAVRLADSMRVSLAGYMWIALLPFRLGEFARPLMLAERTEIGIKPALGTVAIERVLDGLIICTLFFVASAGNPSTELPALLTATTGVMALFGVALTGLLVMARWPRAMTRIIDATLGRVWARAGQWTSGLSEGVAQGLTALPRGGPAATFIAITSIYWASNAVGMWVLAQGCGLPIGVGDAVLVMAVMNIALLVPGGPAQVGIFQTGVALGLHLVLPADTIRDDGSAFAFYLYLCQLGSITVAGGWAQRSLGLPWRTVLGRFAPPPKTSS